MKVFMVPSPEFVLKKPLCQVGWSTNSQEWSNTGVVENEYLSTKRDTKRVKWVEV